MSHGLPAGYVRLYDAQGNPVEVRLDRTGEYALAVTDERTGQLVEILSQQTALLRGIYWQLAQMTGSAMSESDFSKE